MTIGDRIKERLEEIGMSTGELAIKIGVSDTALYDMYKRDDFKWSNLKKIAGVLRVPTSWLTGEAEDQPGPYIRNEARQVGLQNTANISLNDCLGELKSARELITELRERLTEKDKRIADKEEIINILKMQRQ